MLNNQPRPEAEVLGRPPRGGHLREVAPVGGCGSESPDGALYVRWPPLGAISREGPVGAVDVTRGSTHPGDGPTHPARGYPAAPGPRSGPPCSRSNPSPRSEGPSSDALAATPDGSGRHSCPSGTRSYGPRCTWAGCSGTGGRGRASHAPPPTRSLADGQLPQDHADLAPQPSVEDATPILRYDHDVVLAVPPHMGQVLPLVHRLPLLPERAFPEGEPMSLGGAMHAGSLEALRVT